MSEVRRYNTELEKDGGLGLPSLTMRSSNIGSWVEYKDYAALEAKCAALAAENATMHETIEAVRSVADNSSGIAGWHLNGDIATWEEILPEINDIETPATDAFLAEVRAQGVEMFAEMYACEAIKDGDVEGWKSNVSNAASEYAAQLRKEAAQ